MAESIDPMLPPLWRHFMPADPYAGFDPRPYPHDLQGWNADDPAFAAVIAHVRPRLIVEVGTWKGASAIHMARLCRDLAIPAQILCIDTWLGSREFFLWRDKHPEWFADLRHRHGWPHLYYQFLANVVREGLTDVITPFPISSAIGARLLGTIGLQPDMIYLDGSHDEEDVARDLPDFFAILRPGGVLLGDDYIAWPGLTRAVDQFAAAGGEKLWGRHQKFAILKGGDAAAIPGLR